MALHDTRCPLPSPILAQAIAEVDHEVQEATSIGRKRTECGSYKRYRASVGGEIGKYASHHGVAAVAQYSSK